MESLKKIEHTIEGWLKSVPHLPVEWRHWLGANVWWIVIIGVVASAVAIISTLGILFGGAALIGGLGLYGGYGPAVAASSAFFAWGFIHTLIALAFLAAQGLLLFTAIKPLRAKKQKGWSLLFAALVVSGVASVVSAVLTFSFGGFISGIFFGAIGFAIGAYLAFEIKGEFTPVKVSKPEKKVVAAKQD